MNAISDFKSMGSPSLFNEMLNDTSETVILDGGLATELEGKGCDISGLLWSAEILINEPKLIEQVHLDYFNAGADVAITASYQASVVGLMQHKSPMTEDQAKQLIKKSVNLAQNARKAVKQQDELRTLYIAGSVGPYGAYLADGSEYRGDYTLPEQEMMEFHRSRIDALVESGVDVLAFETIPSYAESMALLRLLEKRPRMFAWFSFTLKDERHISDGTSLAEVVRLLEGSSQVLAIGVNCVSEALGEAALTTLSRLTTKPLLIYPNSGETYDANTKTWSGEHSQGDALKEKAQRWKSLGARLIGGCCRTTPESIRTIRNALR
jgi:homocysteine S-methyltransferase